MRTNRARTMKITARGKKGAPTFLVPINNPPLIAPVPAFSGPLAV
jgi:hypothetical protein